MRLAHFLFLVVSFIACVVICFPGLHDTPFTIAIPACCGAMLGRCIADCVYG